MCSGHCQKNWGLIRNRHDTLVSAVKGAACAMNWQVIAEDQVFGSRGQRPDFVLANRQGYVHFQQFVNTIVFVIKCLKLLQMKFFENSKHFL